ncbi:MAG: hypothetical protein ACLPX9_00910 [Rhodomicrobium sp.]
MKRTGQPWVRAGHDIGECGYVMSADFIPLPDPHVTAAEIEAFIAETMKDASIDAGAGSAIYL